MAVNFGTSAWDPSWPWYLSASTQGGCIVGGSSYVYPSLPAVDSYLAAIERRSRQAAHSAFWGSDRRDALADYDAAVRLRKEVAEAEEKIRTLTKALEEAKQPKTGAQQSAPRRKRKPAPTKKKRSARKSA